MATKILSTYSIPHVHSSLGKGCRPLVGTYYWCNKEGAGGTYYSSSMVGQACTKGDGGVITAYPQYKSCNYTTCGTSEVEESGNTLTLTIESSEAGFTPSTYSWKKGETEIGTESSITVSASGDYSVTVTGYDSTTGNSKTFTQSFTVSSGLNVYMGDKQITKIYLGSTEITSLHIGGN